LSYFDEEGSDDILNAIVTQTTYAGRVIKRVIQFLEQGFLAAVYFAVAMMIAPVLTIATGVILGGFTIFFRQVIESGYDVGDRVAEANEERQEAVQAATQGIRDVRIFGVAEELYSDFRDAVEKFTRGRITLRRNEAAINKFYNLVVAVSVFVLIYFALTFSDLSLGSLGVFLFAMFRLGPRASNVNELFYQVENDLPHLVRTIEFVEDLEAQQEPQEAEANAPEEVTRVEFDNVHFSYDGDEQVLRGLDFEVEKGEFIGFVGQSGAGKSTIVSLLSRMYVINDGEIRANGVSIEEMDISGWRDRISVVRQNPFVFNNTLRYNLTIGNRDVSDDELDRVCEIAKVDEFREELPEGYDTMLGDDGVRLSGGQKQRVALARALLEDADLLILDEATSDLDSNLEKQVQQAIEAMDRDYAIVTIAHRLSTVKNADRIYTVEKGKITEAGKHNELVEECGKYAELYGIQVNQ
jgi:subfamily B ATP-binding cassette protein MsbA